MHIRAASFGTLLILAACQGHIGENVAGAPGSVGVSGMRRLTRGEHASTIRDLVGDFAVDTSLLGEDARTPFDNDQATQKVSSTVVLAAESIADRVAARVVADPERRDAIVGCRPAGAGDAACFRAFIARFGLRALRRPLVEEEIQRFLELQAFAVEEGDFYVAVELALRALLQHPEFLYRIERGTPVPGRPDLYRLSSWEVASRLSYFIWGSTPDETLLALAAAGALADGPAIREAAARMLLDSRARERIQRFHELWLAYDKLPHAPELGGAMRAETRALVARVVLDEQRSWLDLLRAEETFVEGWLAEHYGLTAVESGAAWVPYADSGRRGLLSHGTFLSLGGRFGTTSPTQRGKLVRELLLCEPVPPPPPDVDTNMPPGETTSPCKVDRYAAHASVGSCAACHQFLDPVGFGLERYDQAGRYRSHDDGLEECTISGEGALVPYGSFAGPAGLSELLIASGALERCLVKQVVRFAMGRQEQPADAAMLEALTARFRADAHRFDQLILAVVASDAFRHRAEEQE
jgi:hypothetical protein